MDKIDKKIEELYRKGLRVGVNKAPPDEVLNYLLPALRLAIKKPNYLRTGSLFDTVCIIARRSGELKHLAETMLEIDKFSLEDSRNVYATCLLLGEFFRRVEQVARIQKNNYLKYADMKKIKEEFKRRKEEIRKKIENRDKDLEKLK